jgi:hypothetical protein
MRITGYGIPLSFLILQIPEFVL